MSNLTGFVKRLRDIMRNDAGINGDAQRIEQIAWMLFLKVYDAKEQDWAWEDENYQSIIPQACRWQNWAHDDKSGKAMTGDKLLDFVNNRLFPVLKGRDIEDSNGKIQIPGVRVDASTPISKAIVQTTFADANQYMKDGVLLRQVLNIIDELDLSDYEESHAFGEIYETILKELQSAGSAGEFYTPRSIVKLMIMLLAPQAGESVYDPACGTGGMLIEAIRYMKGDKLTYGRIYGQEKNLATSAIARMNLFLHGAKDFRVTQGDTLRSPNYLWRGSLQTFDCVVANPPFSLKNWGAEQFSSDIYGRNLWGCPTDSNGDFAWLQHMVKSMNPKTGRCAVVLPQGVLFRSGKEGEIRKQLVESDKLECVITLTGGVFYSTGVSACILFLNNNKNADHRGKICLIDASGIYTPQRAQNVMTEEDIQKVYSLYSAYEDVIERVKIATIADIREKDYTLAINNYIEKKEQETIPPEEVRRQYFEAYEAMLRAEEKMKRLLLDGGYVSE